ncbi:MAG: hypothetical protein M0Z75_01975 [Nitrospiraceae bacterium]|nr:hypothetical protein [Nitrospiraceae bacterium]
MRNDQRAGLSRYQSMFKETFGLGPAAALTFLVFVILALLFAVYWFFHSAPPSTIIMTSGPRGSIFRANAEKYKKILARSGIHLNILASEGSLQNLTRLTDPSFKADIGFVQGGETGGLNIANLVSLGSLYDAPILIFYRNDKPIELISRFEGMRLAIGPPGSGTRTLSLALLAANGIRPGGATPFSGLDGDKAVQALIDGDVDAVFLMGDSASVRNIKRLIYATGVRIFSFKQAAAYSRRIVYLNKMVLPMGSVDFGQNIPEHDVDLVGPTVELIARKGLHPALTDLLIEASREIYGSANLLRHQGEFPAPQQHEFTLSKEAVRYYKSGASFLYRSLPFRFASLANRILVVVVPLIVVLIPGLKIIPVAYRWRIMIRFYRWYRALMILEHDMTGPLTANDKEGLLKRLDHLEESVANMKVPASFANQFYGLREHIDFVRDRLAGGEQPS